MLDPLDHDYRADLIRKRDEGDIFVIDAYFQGRIDEYCSQNAIDQIDSSLDLRLSE